MLFEVWLYEDILVGARAVVQPGPRDGHGGGIVGWAAHLVNIPIGLQIAKVADPDICAEAFYFLVVPKREGVVVAVGEDDGVTPLLQ